MEQLKKKYQKTEVFFILSIVCVCVYLFFYPGGDLNLNTYRLMGISATVGI